MFASQVEPFTLDESVRHPIGYRLWFPIALRGSIDDLCEGKFAKLPPWKRFLLGGSILGVLIFFFPPLYGEGYNTINTLLAGGDLFQSLTSESLFYNIESRWTIVTFLVLVILFKVFATSATNGGGVPVVSLPPPSSWGASPGLSSPTP